MVQLPHDLSPLGMYLQADIFVKSVMISLALASLATWTILFAKMIQLNLAKRQAKVTLVKLGNAKTWYEAEQTIGFDKGAALLLKNAAQAELQSAQRTNAPQGTLDRIGAALARIEAGAVRKIGVGAGVLATIGSIAPFVGLLGTVWGIMNAFIGISKAQTTNLAVVAPGIAEALFATALGLVAAIPAVIVYNWLTRSIAGYRHILADIACAIERLIGRDLEKSQPPVRLMAAE